MLNAEHLGVERGGRALLESVNLDVKPGEVIAVLGANGAGKSTLLRLLARELAPTVGAIQLNGRPIEYWSASELARQRAVLPQSDALRFAFEVRQVVALGRFPWGVEAASRAREVTDAAMHAADIFKLATRRYTELSAGERARVQFARVLAQIWESEPGRERYLLLDEPTASLDLAHQHSVLAMTRRFAASGVGVVMVLHDPNLALLYADRSILLKQGRVLACGRTCEVLTAQLIRDTFGIDVDLISRPGTSSHWIAPRPRDGTASQNSTP